MTTSHHECLQIGPARVLHMLFAHANDHAPNQPIAHESDALPLIAEARAYNATWIVIPVEHLAPEFFELASGLAGAVLQKFVNYGVHVAIVGEMDYHLARSNALQAFVRESNRGNTIWFAQDLPAFKAMLREASGCGTQL